MDLSAGTREKLIRSCEGNNFFGKNLCNCKNLNPSTIILFSYSMVCSRSLRTSDWAGSWGWGRRWWGEWGTRTPRRAWPAKDGWIKADLYELQWLGKMLIRARESLMVQKKELSSGICWSNKSCNNELWWSTLKSRWWLGSKVGFQPVHHRESQRTCQRPSLQAIPRSRLPSACRSRTAQSWICNCMYFNHS